jgi:hypothetical protein
MACQKSLQDKKDDLFEHGVYTAIYGWKGDTCVKLYLGPNDNEKQSC